MNAESSTIRHVSGSLVLTELCMVSNMTILPYGVPTDSRNQVRCDLAKTQHLLCVASLYCHAGHAKNRTARLVLRDGLPARFFDLPKPAGPIASHTRHDYCGGKRTVVFSHRTEQHVN